MIHAEYLQFHEKFSKQGRDLAAKKSRAYGKEDDVFANIKSIEVLGIPAFTGLIARMMDKMSRLSNMNELSDESLYDVLLDLMNYTIIFAALYTSRDVKLEQIKDTEEEIRNIEKGGN